MMIGEIALPATRHSRCLGRVFALAVLCVLADPANAAATRCFTTDDGLFPCRFRLTDSNGSFEITGSGKPRYLLNIVEPGIANGFVTLGGRNISLPGQYRRSTTERGCWVNEDTKTKICAF
jgi:hypothetical protein